MSSSIPSARRDRRFVLQPGSSRVEFVHPGNGQRCSGELTMMSVAGIALRSNSPGTRLAPGTIIDDVTLRVGDCVVRGEIAIKNLSPATDGRTQLGCLFYPATGDAQVKWMTLLAGMAAVQAPD